MGALYQGKVKYFIGKYSSLCFFVDSPSSRLLIEVPGLKDYPEDAL